MTHAKRLPYFLHSSGKVDAIMEDLIADVGIDGKHSFEDAIIPVQDFQTRYGRRIAVLGGLDINILSGGTAEEVRAHTRFLIETCGPRGRYAVGSGNSVPSYVPVENYLAMIEETHLCNLS
jgi:uroporphyrinogen decarboxylase